MERRDVGGQGEAERQSEAWFDALHEGALLVDAGGRIVLANPSVEDLIGWPPADLPGRPVSDLLPSRLSAELGARLWEFFAAPARRGPLRLPMLHKDGSEIDVDVVISPVEHGSERVSLATIRAAVPAPRVEQAALAEDELLAMLHSGMPFQEAIHALVEGLGRRFGFDVATLWLLDDRVARLRCSVFWQRDGMAFPTFERATLTAQFGAGEGLIGRVWTSGAPVTTDDLGRDPRAHRASAAARDGLRAGVAFPIRDEGHTVAVIELYRSTVGEPDAGLRRSLARIAESFGPFVGRFLSEEHLSAERARLQLALDVGNMGVWEWDVRTDVVRWSANLQAVVGEERDFLGTVDDFVRILHPEDEERTLRAFLRTLDRESDDDLEIDYRVLAADGTVHWIETRGRAIRDESGHVALMTGISTDVTEKKRAALGLEGERARLRLALEAGALGTWELDLAADEVRVSPYLVQLFGLPAETVPFDTVVEMIHPEERDLVAVEILDAIQTGGRIDFTHRITAPDGTVRWVEGRGAAVTDGDGVVRTVTGVAGDVTVRRLAEMRAENERARLQLALDAGAMGLWEWNVESDHVHWTDQLDGVYGADTNTTLDAWASRLHAKDRESTTKALRELIGRAGDATIQHRVAMHDGSRRWVELRVRRVTGPAGHVRLVGVGSDISERKEQEQRLRRKTHLLETLNDLGRAVAARLDLRQVVQMVTDAGTDLTGATVGAFLERVVDDAGERFEVEALSGPEAGAIDFPVTSMQLLRDALSQRRTLRLENVAGEGRAGAAGTPVRSLLAVPVLAGRGELHGALCFGHSEVGEFSGHDEVLATGIAAQAAVAIENARLFEAAQRELEGRRKALAERDSVVRELQRSLLPPHLPEGEGVRFAARFRPGVGPVGGDFYDVFPLGHHQWGIAIGDVCGKGHEAAALTALARHTLRSAAVVAYRPREVLRFLNDAIMRDETSLFCATGYGRLRVERGRVVGQLGLAGHPNACIVRADRGVESHPRTTGMVLGVVDEPPVGEGSIRLAEGDALVLCTDGVLEARGETGRFGTERLERVLMGVAGEDPETIATAIVDAVDHFEVGTRRDDVAVLVVAVST